MEIEKFLMPDGEYCNKLRVGTTEVIVPEKVTEIRTDKDGVTYRYRGIRHDSCGQQEVQEMIRLIHQYERLVEAAKRYYR